jgi:hypothetical protein
LMNTLEQMNSRRFTGSNLRRFRQPGNFYGILELSLYYKYGLLNFVHSQFLSRDGASFGIVSLLAKRVVKRYLI